MFDLKSFERAAFEPRQCDVALPSLADFFKDSEPVFVVRGLTANELARADEAARKGKMISDLVEKLLESQGGKEKAAALLDAAGLSNAIDPPQIIKQRIEHVRMAVVSPALELQHVIKLADAFPIEFTRLANAVLEMTGQGQVAAVKQKPSGKSPK